MNPTPTKTARIGLLGGTFDPPHLAHLAIAHAALDAFALDEVRFVVAAQPYQKTDVSDVSDRVAMVERAVADEPRFVLDTVELERAGPSYTIDTLDALRGRVGTRAMLALILGSDQYRNLPSWHRRDDLTRYASIAVARRGDDPQLAATALPDVAPLVRPHGECVSFAMPPLEISASAIRDALRHGRDARRWLPTSVLTYIQTHALYRSDA